VGKDAIFWEGEGFFFRADGEVKIGKHSGFEPVIGIWDESADLDGAGGHIDLGLDEIDFANENLVSVSGDFEVDGLAGLDTCTVAFGNTKGEFHAIEGVEANESGLGIDVLTDANCAVTKDPSEGSGQGIFLESFAGEEDRGQGPHRVCTGLIVFLLGNSAVGEEGIGALECLLSVKVVGFCLRDTRGLFGFVDLEKNIAFFNDGTFDHGDGGYFSIDLGLDVDGFFCLKAANGSEGFEEGTFLDGNQFDGNRSIFRRSATFLTGAQSQEG
jgi:hypothetical protein